ncbi:MAG: phospholipid carrier-dependent glycosyltransferase [Terriglobales bacterium]|jgi:4-amino-4-deoxy-L-arabinose transferase-like glycosyltransferase
MAQLSTAPEPRNLRFTAAVAFLLLLLSIELIVPARRQSAAFDEGCHTLAGYRYWTQRDFALNPEHPPLVKLLAAVPLLAMPLQDSTPPPMFFKVSCFVGGKQFLYSNNADAVLFRARMAAATLTILAALVVFAAAYEMFSPAVALLALLLFVFEPNLIAHGSLVTTDMGMTLFLFATVYAFYRYLRKPSLARLLLTALCAGLALASKHSALLLAPILLLLAFAEILLNHPHPNLASGNKLSRLNRAFRLAASLAAIAALAIAILWASYGFHFSMRPQGPPTIPTLRQYVASMHHPRTEWALTTLAHYRLLPEAYLFGLADLAVTTQHRLSFLLGKVYLHGRWFYFPAAFAIKSTLGFLLLLLLLPVALAIDHARPRRELLFLAIPVAVYFSAAMHSDFNIGIRHILPIYPFLVVLAAYAASVLARSHKAWLYAVSALVLFHVVSSARAFPDYLPYSNEAWGGPANTYKFLTDSNVDWGQQLKLVKTYLDDRGIHDCWFAYSARLAADPAYYQVPCKPLPQRWVPSPENMPPRISGTVLISATELSPVLWGPGDLNPYASFRALHPDAEIADGVFVFHGHFDLPLLAAMGHAQTAERLLENGNLNADPAAQALAEAQAAVSLAPGDVASQAALGDALTALRRPDEARAAYQRALALAQTHYPEFQKGWLPELQRKLQ